MKSVPRDVASADDAVRSFCEVYEWIGAQRQSSHRYVGGERAMTIEEIHAAMRAKIPTLTREKLRKVLHKANHKHSMRRVKRGTYIREPWNWRRWEETQDSDEPDAAWYQRQEQRRSLCRVLLLAHYLLPNRATYRKARDLGVGERTYFYYLGTALEDIAFYLSCLKPPRDPTAVCSATPLKA